MDKGRLASTLSVVAVVLAVLAAVLSYANNGRVTWQSVALVSALVVLAIGIRGRVAAQRSGREGTADTGSGK